MDEGGFVPQVPRASIPGRLAAATRNRLARRILNHIEWRKLSDGLPFDIAADPSMCVRRQGQLLYLVTLSMH